MWGRRRRNPQNDNDLGGPDTYPTISGAESQMTRHANPVAANPAQAMRTLPSRAMAPTKATETMMMAREKVALAQRSLAYRRAARPNATKNTRAINAVMVKRTIPDFLSI